MTAFIIIFLVLVVAGALFGRQGINWRKVRQLKVGMSEREIISKVGKPYSVTGMNDKELWVWVSVNAKSNGSFSVEMKDGIAVKVPVLPKSFT